MITDFDDYCIHQTSQPVAQPQTSDRNFYDRYWFNGLDKDGAFLFEVGFGVYPNRFVMDGHFSVSVGDMQHSFHSSRRAPTDRSETQIGPLKIQVLEPMRSIRVSVDANETGIECDLTFYARTAPSEEPKNAMHDGVRVLMDNSRFTQLGHWEGYFSVNGGRTDVKRATTFGTRDKSWGVRPVGESEAGAPSKLSAPGVYWVWSPIHFDDMCTQFGSFEDFDAKPTQLSACIVPAYSDMKAIPRGEDPDHQEMESMTHKIHWKPGTRQSQGAEFHYVSKSGEKLDIELTPLRNFYMLGIGYQHPEWAHAVWHDELKIGGESWQLSEVDPLDYKNIHIHQLVKAKMGDREGVGTLETICFGRHPSGFNDLLDGAS